MSDRPPSQRVLLRTTWNDWAPIVGAAYAEDIAKAFVWRLLRLPVLGVLLIPIVLNQATQDVPTAKVGLVLIALWCGIAVALPLLWRRDLSKVADRMMIELRESGHDITSSPILRSPERFSWWCEDQEVTRAQVRALPHNGGLP